MRAVHSLSPHDQKDKKKEKRKKSIGPIGQRIQAAGQGSGGQGTTIIRLRIRISIQPALTSISTPTSTQKISGATKTGVCVCVCQAVTWSITERRRVFAPSVSHRLVSSRLVIDNSCLGCPSPGAVPTVVLVFWCLGDSHTPVVSRLVLLSLSVALPQSPANPRACSRQARQRSSLPPSTHSIPPRSE